MAQEENEIGSYTEFKNKTLSRIIKSGYNTLQLMALMNILIMDHLDIMSNFFASSSRFGTQKN